MAYQRWKHLNTTVFNLGYHLIWTPKYRKSFLIGPVKDRLEKLLYEKAEELDIDIESLEIMPDHLHLFVKPKPVHSPQFIVNQFKGYTSRHLRDEFKHLTKVPSLWTRSYYIESVGHISEDTIKKYIEEQWNSSHA